MKRITTEKEEKVSKSHDSCTNITDAQSRFLDFAATFISVDSLVSFTQHKAYYLGWVNWLTIAIGVKIYVNLFVIVFYCWRPVD